MDFKEVKAEDLSLNPFTMIGKGWFLITAGDEKKFNTMTAGWGGMGVVWGKNAVFAFIRQTRYTKEFVDANHIFTLSFFGREYRKALNICGSISGRDGDKAEKAGLTPFFTEGSAAFQEADMIFICKKMYQDLIKPEFFMEGKIDETWYGDKDYHTMYVGEILKALVK